jgi:hypothetical protein
VTGLASLRELGSDVIWHVPAQGLRLLEIPLVTRNTSGRKPLELPHRGTLVTILALRSGVGSE